MREAARSFSPEADYSDEEAEAFFARCMLGGSGERSGAGAARSGGERAAACPECGGQPQGGVLRPLAHGDELKLFCSDCFGEWTFARGKCAVCGETEAAQLRYHTADRLPHLRTMTCDGCKSYLHLIDLSKEVQAVPEVDEIAAVALDIWAVEQGYSKPRPNLAGI